MVESISTCQIDANKVTWHCLYFPQSIPSLHWVIKARIIENTRGSKNCPNEWPFCLGYYSMCFYPNHVTRGLFSSHDVMVAYIITSGPLLMSALHTILISQKWANIGAVFWATVNGCTGLNEITLGRSWSTRWDSWQKNVPKFWG